MARQIRWRQLVPGIVLFCTGVLLAVGVLIFGRIGRLHGETVRFYTSLGGARGIMRGSEVWLGGKKTGRVEAIHFNSPESDTSRRLVLELEILAKFRPQFREDSYAQVRTGGRLVGAMVVYVTPGTLAARALEEGDTLPSRQQPDVETITSYGALAARDVPVIARNVKDLATSMSSAKGTVGAMRRPDAPRQLEVLLDNTSRLTERASRGRGTIALALQRGEVLSRAREVVAQGDSLRALFAGAGVTLGRFRRDSTALKHLASVRSDVLLLRSRLADAEGTAGRFLSDSAIVQELARLDGELAALFADVKRRPFRYLAF